MREFIAFTKKEIIEQIRTYKWLIVLSVFFLFGMISPLFAKLMPDIMSGMKVQGIKIEIPEPTVMDAYAQFFKNFTQMGMLILLLVFGGILSNELTKGTLINVLAKGLSRTTVILAKFISAVLLWTVGYLVSIGTAYGYTMYLFKEANVPNLVFSLFCLWLFGCFLIALILLSSSMASGNFGGLVLSAVTLVILLMINVIPKTEKFNPITLASKNLNLVNETTKVSDLYFPIIITSILTILVLYFAVLLFKKKKM
jgi:hypothetical protein